VLILKRKIDEQIVIGDSVFVTIVSIKDGVVGLGIEAPPEVPLHRREIFDGIVARDGHISPGGNTARPRVTPRASTPGGPLPTGPRDGPASIRHERPIVGHGWPRTGSDRTDYGYPAEMKGDKTRNDIA
jgi:carbon storage regulator